MKTHLQTPFLGKKTNYIFMWLSLLLLLANSAKAQYIPSYSFSASVGTYVPLTTGTVVATGTVDDLSYPSLNIGFPFVYDGVTYTTFSINANGLIRMGSTSTSSYNIFDDQVENAITALNEDLQGTSAGELRYDTIGTAPNRILVVQWANWAFYSVTSDTMNFQIRLHESSNVIEFAYGNFYKVNDDYVVVGITGDPGSQMNARTTGTDWNATTASGSPYDYCFLSSLGPILPANGLKYTFTPPPKVYNTSIVEAGPNVGVAPGGVNQVVGSLKVSVGGLGSYLPTSSITVNTTGTTNLADITNLRVYYTGTSPAFSSATQFGTDVTSPLASNIITDSINLSVGDNYFWVTYDISASATLGNVVDAVIPNLTVGNVLRTPTVTAPVGNRQISSPMTFVSGVAQQGNLTSMGQGTLNNELLKMMVITSSTGSAVDLTQFDLSALGTTDTSNIRNLSVWYTGNSNVFSTTNQFGSTLAMLPGTITYSIVGSQSLINDTNYFWLTTDITNTATIGNVVDAEWSSSTIGGNPEVPTVTAPAGTRAIRADYCEPIVSNAMNSCDWGYYITAVSTSGATGNLSNSSGCNGNSNNYINITNQTLTIKPTETVTINLGDYTNWITYAVWIDYNQDGIFDNVTERVFQGSTFQNESFVSGNFTVPCSAMPGITRMRIRGGDYWWFGSPIGDPCSDVGYGETEDYKVVVLPNPVSYMASTAVQQTGLTFPGGTDRAVLRVPVTVEGCGVGVVNNFRFSTAGTTTPADITNAMLYRTGSSTTFNNSTLLGTVAAPSGQFSFVVTDTLLEDGITNYWLAYDISGSAVVTNVIDATFDSVSAVGAYHIPMDVNPLGNIVVTAPMTYVSSAAIQPNTFKVARGISDNEVIGVAVVMSSSGAPMNLTELNFSANGTTDTAEISNMRVWYTGNNPTFGTTTPFGNALNKLPGTLAFTVTGLQPLYNDTNYFWLTYDVDAAAVIGNEIDGECTGLTVNATVETPTITAPAGTRLIREEYCEPLVSDGVYSCNSGYYSITDFATSGGTTNISNYGSTCSGGSGNPNNFTYFSGQLLTVNKSSTITLSGGNSWNTLGYAVWIDYNQDGVFDNVTERVAETTDPNGVYSFSSNVTIPCSALAGPTRMRVRSGATWYWGNAAPSSPCTDMGYGESEDYDVMILELPVSYTSSNTIQVSGVAAPSDVNIPVLRVPMMVNGCGVAVIDNMVFSTAGTTATGDIVNAKLYKTGTSTTFSPTNLVGTVSGPSGSFVFTITDTLSNNEENNYWLTYDINGSATLGNTIDATFDSVNVLGGYHIPSATNPSGNYTLAAPMSYLGSSATQTNLQKVGRGTAHNQILGLQVVMSTTGAPTHLTQLDFSAFGTTDTANIRNIKVWSTGASSTFATVNQYGSTLATLPGTVAFTVMGDITLLNDTNYFWVSYDVDVTSTIGNALDAECLAITIAGTPETPSITAPTGNRLIREEFCEAFVSNGSYCCTSSYYVVTNFSTSGGTIDINNSGSGCTGGGNTNNYTYFNGQTLTVAQNATITLNVGNWNTTFGYAVWIDYNQDGVFNNTTERVLSSTDPNGTYGYSNTVTIPCEALTGLTRMRVRGGVTWWFGLAAPSSPCTDLGYGETEDYNVIITENPISFGSATALQIATPTSPGALNKAVLHVPVTTAGCGDLAMSNIHFSTTGTTTDADILNAKLYTTGASSTFNTSTLLGTLSAPSGAFSFAVIDTLEANGTTHYWLAYDINGAATLGNVVDARFDSIEVDGSYEMPVTSNPSGNVQITAALAYSGSTVSQDVLSKVGAGSADNQMLKIQVFMSSTGAPVDMTELSFSAFGSTDTANIRDIKVWYTGNNPTMSFSTQFGNTLAALPGSIGFTVNGVQGLMPDTNYFWLTYSINASATIGNVVDAECGSITVNAVTQTPSVTAPVGTREIRAEYCSPSHGTSLYACIWDVSLNTITNPTGGCGTIPNYTNFPQTGSLTTSLYRGGEYNLSVMTDYSGASISVWFDWNDDGTFAASEWYDLSRSTSGYVPYVYTVTIPNTASLGSIRVRIRTRASTANTSTDACTTFGSGETEDYTITINPTPPQATYVWNQTSPADYTVSSNWTPARTAPFVTDRLVFNAGGSLQVNNVPTQKVGTIVAQNSTTVTLSSSSAVILSVTDTLDLTAGNITESNVTVSIGADVTNVGTIVGNGKISGGNVRRWINTTVTSYNFPLANGSSDNMANITFTAPPTGGTITGRFFASDPATTSGLPLTEGAITVNKVSPFGFWRFTSANGFVNGQHTLTLSADGINFVTNAADLVMVRRANNIASWTLEGTHVTTAGTNSLPVLSRTGVAVIGDFAVAGDVAVNPLPVQMINFKANAVKGDVLLNWSTASELNNNGFDVERSVDGKTFTKVEFVKGKGNSNVLVNYTLTDGNAFTAAKVSTLYYRLRQVDNDGTARYTNTVKVTETKNVLSGIAVYPNPFNQNVSVDFVTSEAASYTVTISDIQGRTVYSKQMDAKAGLNNIAIDQLSTLQSGVYFLKLNGPESQTIKLVKTH